MTVASLSAYASRRSPRPLAVARSVRTAASGSGGVLLLLGVALPVGVSVSRAPGLVLLASMTVALVAWIATHPAHGVYLVVVCTPLTAGIDRGSLIPVLRPSEAIAALVAAALFLRWIFGLKSARDVAIRHSPVATAIVILALTSSLLPAVWLLLRDQPFTTDD
ncbi:MAG: hypothetical protein QOC66_4276, partial [Pseudonocardiales bacterium]|nr:hypothetical protein [Pseudonocardiales bacterium]